MALMIIDNFGFFSVSVFPMEANSPLAVNSNTVLPTSVASKGFEAIAWRNAKVVKALGGVQLVKFHDSAPVHILRKPFRLFALKDMSGSLVWETLDHSPIIVGVEAWGSQPGITNFGNSKKAQKAQKGEIF